jgi:probable aminopeptidase NPEPL1
VTRLVLVKDFKAAARGADTLLVVAPQALFVRERFPALLDAPLDQLLVDVAADVSPGDGGSLGSTLTGASPRRLLAGVLPDRVSRYNCAARPEAIHRVVSAAPLGHKRAALVLVLESADHVLPALNAVGRAFPLFTARSERRPERKVSVAVVDPEGAPLPVPAEAMATVESAREAAALVDTPPTELDPAAFAARVKASLRGIPRVTVQEIAGDALLRRGLGGIHAVGRAATTPPRMVVATYAPPRKAAGRHVALVGKGVTFDTGGLHLKARGMMESMKSDMGGAAAIAGAFRVLAARGGPDRISMILCLAENAIGPGAYKPDDVLTLHSGKTVEINNTDAEGRLLLGDGVSWAARELGAEVVIDAATLTGAQLIATGLAHAALVSNDAELERLFVAAGHRSGDLVHPLPFAPELYRGEFKSPIADMRNSVKNRNNAQSSCAAQFIYNHLEGAAVRWAHVDLAGPAFRGDRGTGFGVALLVEAVTAL